MSDGGDFDDFSDDDFEDFEIEDEEEEDIDAEANSDEEQDSDDDMENIDASEAKHYKSIIFDEKAIRNSSERNRIPDSERTTADRVDKYEFGKLLSTRTQAIANGQEPLIPVPAGMTKSRDIAYFEIMMKMTPYILVRYVPHNVLGQAEEWWKLSELIIPQYDF